MTLTGGETFEAPDRTRSGRTDTLDDALADPSVAGLERDTGQWEAPPHPLAATQPVPEPGEPPKGDEALARWVAAYVDHAIDLGRERFIEVAGAQNEGIKALIEEHFDELHDPYKVFYKGFLIGAASLLVAMLLLVAIGVLFMAVASR